MCLYDFILIPQNCKKNSKHYFWGNLSLLLARWFVISIGARGREGTLPWGSAPYPFIQHFPAEKLPSIGKWYHFHVPSLELCILFNCCKCTVFQVWINHKIRFCRLFHSHKKNASVSPFCPFYDQNDKSPYPTLLCQQWNPYPFIYLKLEKGTPFGQSLPV